MKFNRNVFWKLISIFAVMDLCWLMAGCGDWENTASQIITLLGPALQALVAILAAFGVGVSASVVAQFNSWAQQAQTSLVTIKALIDSYKTAAATAQPGILNEIQAGLTALTSQLVPIMSELHITDPASQAKFAAGVAAVTAFITSLITLIPSISSAVTLEAEKKLADKAMESTGQFKSNFNGAVSYFGNEYCI